MSSGSAYARSIASRARSIRRFTSSVLRLMYFLLLCGFARIRSNLSLCQRSFVGEVRVSNVYVRNRDGCRIGVHTGTRRVRANLRSELIKQGVIMTDPARDEETRREVQAALGARRELGFEYEEAIAAGLLDRVNQLALMRASEIRREAERVDHERRGGEGVPAAAVRAGDHLARRRHPDHRHQRQHRRTGPRRRTGRPGPASSASTSPPPSRPAPQTLGKLPNCLIAAHRPRR